MEDLHGDLVVLHRAILADASAFRAMLATPEIHRWWTWPDMETQLAKANDDKHKSLAITVDGHTVGMLSWYEETGPEVRYAGMDIFIDPPYHRRGYGVDALRTLSRWLFGPGGHHRLVIDPHVENTPAVACYEKVGFRPIGVMRKYIQVHGGPWEDALLMDLLIEEANFLT